MDPHPESVLPSLSLLAHTVRSAPAEVSSLSDAATADVALVDARLDLAAARGLCRRLSRAGATAAVVGVINEGGLVAVSADWGLDEILLPGAGPAEVDARLRLLQGRREELAGHSSPGTLVLGEVMIDEANYVACLRGRPMQLAFKEFELLKYLVEHPGRVFTRAQLLQSVWGYDFFGGTRTVDVHVRRLRVKLGTEYESLISTVRNVGYKAVHPPTGGKQPADSDRPDESDGRC
jgi:DNA-binding response OmpR family regulator